MPTKQQYKSLRVPVELHEKIKQAAEAKYMSIIMFIQYTLDQKDK